MYMLSSYMYCCCCHMLHVVFQVHFRLFSIENMQAGAGWVGLVGWFKGDRIGSIYLSLYRSAIMLLTEW